MIITIGIFNGPILGVFLIGYFLPRCNLKSVWTGLILSFVTILWISLGGWYYKTPVKTLPFSVDECDISNFTSINISKSEEFNHISNNQ
ncbi:Sodium-coupled monocarboxylate transporter 2 [Armadillidium vulgare]|nr:Sodium-coupled monocarboxylate transporter 2 [Armadillidium vulgare]